MTMIYVAAKDTVLVPKFHALAVGKGIPNANVIINSQAGHFMLASKLNVPAGTHGSEVNEDPAGFDRRAAIDEASVAIPKWFSEKIGPY